MIKKRVAFVFLLIIVIILNLITQGFVPSMLLYMLISTALFSILYSYLLLKNIKVVESFDSKTLLKGKKTIYKCTFYLPDKYKIISGLCCYTPIKAYFVNNIKLFKGQFDDIEFIIENGMYKMKFEVLFNYIGIYETGLFKLETIDFLGLIYFKRENFKLNKIKVNPRLLKIKNIEIWTTNNNEQSTFSYYKSDELSMIRDYEEGDSLSRIHWKLSSKQNKLFTREFTNFSQNNNIFILDIQDSGLDKEDKIILEDKIIETAIAVFYYYIKKGIPLDVIYGGKNINQIKVTNMKEFNYIYKSMTEIDFHEELSVSKLLKKYHFINKSLISQKDITLITANLSKELFLTIDSLTRKMVNVNLIYISKNKLNNEIIDVETEFINYYNLINGNMIKVNIDDNIEEIEAIKI